MKKPSNPLFFVENGDVVVFKSLREAVIGLEAIDVKNNEYIGYDSQGHLLQLTAPTMNKVEIELAEEKPTHEKDLEMSLRHFLIQISDPIGMNDEYNLEKLVKYFSKFAD